PFVSFSSCAAHAAPLSSLSLHDALPIFLRPVRTAIGECSGREAAPGAVSSDLSVDRGGGRTSVDEGMRFPSPIACSALRGTAARSEEHTSELQSRFDLVCRLLLEKQNTP